MGKSPDDIAGEIEGLRQESDIIVDELLRRTSIPNLAKGVTSTVADRASYVINEAAVIASGAASTVTHMADEMPEPVRQHRFAATLASVGLLAGLLGFALSWAALSRRQTASDRAVRRMRDGTEQVSENLRRLFRRADEARREIRTVTPREESSMVKRLLWVGLASVMTALGSMLFRRMTASFWRTAMREEPPKD